MVMVNRHAHLLATDHSSRNVVTDNFRLVTCNIAGKLTAKVWANYSKAQLVPDYIAITWTVALLRQRCRRMSLFRTCKKSSRTL